MAVTSDGWLQAQYSVLGAALLDSDLVPKVMSETQESDYSGPCRNVYRAMRKLFLSGSIVDPVSVTNSLGADHRGFIMQLMELTPTTANLDHYITLCREQARVLAIREVGHQLTLTESGDEARKLIEQASSMMVDKPSLRITTMADALKSFMNRHTGTARYLTWPVPELNDRLYAEPGDFIVIGGYPSTGKSAWSLQCAWHLSRNYKVGFFSLETSSEKLFDRQMASVARISMDEIKRNSITQDNWDKLCAMTQEITTRNIELIPAAGMSPADVRAVTMMRGYQVIFIDYLQLLSGTGGNRTEQVSSISIALHTMAQSMGVTVFALSQLARQSTQEKSSGKAVLRESGQIDQDADIIMILSLEKKDDPSGNRILSIDKNKEGTCPNILLAFDGKHQTFTKAQRTGDVLGKFVADGKKAKRQRREAEPQEEQTFLPLPDDYKVPF